MAATIAAKLDFDDLSRWRLMAARDAAIDTAPSHFSRTEIEEANLRRYQLYGEIAEKYGVDDSRQWKVAIGTGVVIYGAWE